MTEMASYKKKKKCHQDSQRTAEASAEWSKLWRPIEFILPSAVWLTGTPPAGVLRAASPQHLPYPAVGCTMRLGSLVLCQVLNLSHSTRERGALSAEGLRSWDFGQVSSRADLIFSLLLCRPWRAATASRQISGSVRP